MSSSFISNTATMTHIEAEAWNDGAMDCIVLRAYGERNCILHAHLTIPLARSLLEQLQSALGDDHD